jgi:hypothetical protein
MNFFTKALLVTCGVCSLSFACPNAEIVGKDLSGSYECKGLDHHDGKFSGIFNLKRVKSVSDGQHANYTFNFTDDTGHKVIYTGYAIVAHNNSPLAVYFSNTDAKQKDDFGVATVVVGAKNGKFTLNESYYQPTYYGGNYGTKQCILNHTKK